MQTDRHERNTPEHEEEWSPLGSHHDRVFPKQREPAPKKAEWNHEHVGSPEHDALCRTAAPQQPFIRREVTLDDAVRLDVQWLPLSRCRSHLQTNPSSGSNTSPAALKPHL